ncbi:MAG: type II toxin-antitoxin system RelE/ParE family toxin [Fimbriimonas sp.]|jgi:plasmid stabilization system protein ParE|nr:type II toxin-antitoxin system RelE/ParE family toxin [Fimbriimonas sp.]
MIEYGRFARYDLEDIASWTSQNYGDEQADRYIAMLHDSIQDLADGQYASRPLKDSESIRVSYVRWPKATYGHNVFHERTPDGIYIYRILHSSSDLPLVLVVDSGE